VLSAGFVLALWQSGGFQPAANALERPPVAIGGNDEVWAMAPTAPPDAADRG
jgi:hypothetical protein